MWVCTGKQSTRIGLGLSLYDARQQLYERFFSSTLDAETPGIAVQKRVAIGPILPQTLGSP